MVWMDEKTRAEYFEAFWGASGLGLSIGRCTAPGCKVSFMPPLPACLFMQNQECNIRELTLPPGPSVTLNSADYSFESFNYDNMTDDFALEHFDHTLVYDRQRVQPMIKRAMATAAESWRDQPRAVASISRALCIPLVIIQPKNTGERECIPLVILQPQCTGKRES